MNNAIIHTDPGAFVGQNLQKLNVVHYSRSTLKKLNRAERVGCAVHSASRRKVVSGTGSADVALILQDASKVESL